MELLTTIIIGLLTLSLLVVVHEFGHYWVARRCGVHVIRFSVGFGKPFYRWMSGGGTEFVIAPIPLGGYVRMLGQSDTDMDVFEENPKLAELDPGCSFINKTILQRTAIVAAGPAINILMAFLLYWVLFMSNFERVLPIVAEVIPDSPAAAAGLQSGDRIVSLDNEETENWEDVILELLTHAGDKTPLDMIVERHGGSAQRQLALPLANWLIDSDGAGAIEQIGIVPRELYLPVISAVVAGDPAEQAGLMPGDLVIGSGSVLFWGWNGLVRFVRKHPGQTVDLQVKRGDQLLSLTITPRASTAEGKTIGLIGAMTDRSAKDEAVLAQFQYNPFRAMVEAAVHLWKLTTFSLQSLARMVTGALSPSQLSGPITIVKATGDAVDAGWQVYLNLVALISLSLGILNLLPIPVLDGGHLVYLGAEAVRGKPLPQKIQALGQQLGLILIGILMFYVIYNDILRL